MRNSALHAVGEDGLRKQLEEGLYGVEHACAASVFDHDALGRDVEVVGFLHQAGVEHEDGAFVPVVQGIVVGDDLKTEAGGFLQALIEEADGAKDGAVGNVHIDRHVTVDPEAAFGALQRRGLRHDLRLPQLLLRRTGRRHQQHSSDKYVFLKYH